MKLLICTMYSAGCETEIDIPEVVNWSDVKDWYVKWGILNYTLNDEEWHQIDLDECIEEVDMKRPDSVNILDPNTGETLGED